MLKLPLLLTALGLTPFIASGCAYNPDLPPPATQPSYMSDDCSARSQYEKKSCIPAPPPPPPMILDD
ncbi:MAG: hypothetical protein RKR03_09640 [Candidatus Competibacter sp.]|nr:hypothetical protein [Candidatus Competibacter sp.]